MLYQLAAWAVLLTHLGFILFAVLGSLLVARWHWLAFVHLPAVAWAFYVEWSGRICPLTYLENDFRMQAGQGGYGGGFLEHYLLAAMYPQGLTRDVQFVLAGVVLVVNVAGYVWAFRRGRTHQ